MSKRKSRLHKTLAAMAGTIAAIGGLGYLGARVALRKSNYSSLRRTFRMAKTAASGIRLSGAHGNKPAGMVYRKILAVSLRGARRAGGRRVGHRAHGIAKKAYMASSSLAKRKKR